LESRFVGQQVIKPLKFERAQGAPLKLSARSERRASLRTITEAVPTL